MSYKIIIDSCGELLDSWKNNDCFQSIPLTLEVGEYTIIDDETFNQKDFLEKVKNYPQAPKSACPSPESYREAFDCNKEHVYCVTLSSELSGSYNSAEIGKAMLLEEKPDAKIHVFNSKSASVGETLIALKIQELEEKGYEFDEIIKEVHRYIEEQHTYFLLENLDTLIKNGRISKAKALVASALKIKPVMGSNDDGSIRLVDQARGMNRALNKMADHIEADSSNTKDKVLMISHCNCKERAEALKELIREKMDVRDIIIVDTAGVSSMYANDGGVIAVV